MLSLALIPITPEMHQRWFSLCQDTIEGFPFATRAKASDIVYYRTVLNLVLNVPEKWAFRRFVVDLNKRCIVGTVGFHSGPRLGVLEVGYNVSPEHRGQGIGAESLRMLLRDSVLSDPGLSYLARILPDNTSSINLVERCGFVFEQLGDMENGNIVAHYSLSAERALTLYGSAPTPLHAGPNAPGAYPHLK